VFALYDPIDADHQEQSTLVRVRGFLTAVNIDVAAETNFGVGIYYAQRDAAGALVTDLDPLSAAAFDIESNTTLWLRQQALRPLATEESGANWYTYEWDIKAKRKVEDPNWIVLVMRPSVANDIKVSFNCRVLMDDGY